MRDWAIDYIYAVLEQRDWSANRLAKEAEVAASTINRPLREKNWPHKISRVTIQKIFEASGVDPAPFAPNGLYEGAMPYTAKRPQTTADRVLKSLSDTPDDDTRPNAQDRNEIKIAMVGDLAQIVATVDKAGIKKLQAKLEAVAAMLDD